MLQEHSITNSFLHCFEKKNSAREELFNQSSFLEQVIRYLNEHGVTYTMLRVDSLRNPEEEDEVTEAITLYNK